MADFGFPLPIPHLLLPWDGIFSSPLDVVEMHRIILGDKTYLQENEYVLDFEWEPSNILLMPAPGEEFFIHIGLLGQLLGNVSNPVYIQVGITVRNI